MLGNFYIVRSVYIYSYINYVKYEQQKKNKKQSKHDPRPPSHKKIKGEKAIYKKEELHA